MSSGNKIRATAVENRQNRARELCALIELGAEETAAVSSIYESGVLEPFYVFSADLRNIRTAQAAFEKINGMMTENSQDTGMAWLALCLFELVETENWYRQKQIPDEIFIDTMKCFSRFAREYRESFGACGFNTAFWSYRQLSGTLFRLGTLEFELWPGLFTGEKTEMNGYLHVHIPSDADLSAESRHDSYRRARKFTARYFSEYQFTHFYTNTWLLAPQLRSVLKPGSRILEFQDEYRILSVDNEARSYITRIFKNPSLTIEQWPEETSLQRAVKAYVANGGTIANAAGILNFNGKFS